MVKDLMAGTQVRLKVRTMSGWKGSGTVVWCFGDDVQILREDKPDQFGFVDCARHEVAVMRGQSRRMIA